MKYTIVILALLVVALGVVGCGGEASPRTHNWEYKLAVNPPVEAGAGLDQRKAAVIEKQLNTLGAEGWELFTRDGETGWVLRRPIP